jgi:hypothetical protein
MSGPIDPSERFRVLVAERVAQRASGSEGDPRVPAGVVDELDAHWNRVLAAPPTLALDRAQAAIGLVRQWHGRTSSAPTTSRLPGGSLAHRAVNTAVRRQEQALVDQLHDLAGRVADALDAVLAIHLVGPASDSVATAGRLELVQQQLDELRRAQQRSAARDA